MLFIELSAIKNPDGSRGYFEKMEQIASNAWEVPEFDNKKVIGEARSVYAGKISDCWYPSIIFIYYFCNVIQYSMSKYIDYDGKEYASYEAYCNSPDLDPDIIYNLLARGKRTPQNEMEERWAKEGKALRETGGYEMWFN